MNLSRSPQTLTHSRPMTAGQAWGKVVLQVEVTAGVLPLLRSQDEKWQSALSSPTVALGGQPHRSWIL